MAARGNDTDRLISTAQERLKAAKSADQHNREEAELDLMFRVLQQWDESTQQQREQAAPPRPCITIDRLGAFCNQVCNEIRQSEAAPTVVPRGSGATKVTATAIEGMVRAVLYDSDSQLAFQEAVKYAVVSGAGAFRLDPEMVDEEMNQQVLRVNPIYDPSTVYWDPFAKKPDKSDARWCIVIDVMSRIEYRERWPDSEASASDFVNKDWPEDWMDPRGDKTAVMVAEYWCIESGNSEDVAYGRDMDDARPASVKKWQKAMKTKHVVRHLINGVEELEEPEHRPGECLPIFCVEGDSYWVKGKRYVLSLIRSARDIQRLYNWEATKEVEILAMQATAPYLVTPRMIQNHEQQWQDAPQKNFMYLKFNPDPEMPGPPTRANASAPIEAISAAKMATAQEIKDVIGLQDPNLGRAQYRNQSGVAIEQLRSEGDMSTYHYTDNLSRTLKHFCKVLVKWIPYYYDTEQEQKIINPDHSQDTITINSAAPVQAENGEPYQHDFSVGEYEAAVEITKGYDTAREEEAAFMSNLISSVPDAFWIVGDLMLKSRDSIGADEAAERVKRAIALKTPGLIQDQEGSLPAGAQSQMAAMQAQLQQMHQVIQQQAIEIKTRVLPKQIEAQSRMELEQVKSKTSITKALIDLKAKMHAAGLQHGHAMYDTTLREATDGIDKMLDMLHESELAPGPDQGAQGLHPSAIPEPQPAGAGAKQ